MSIENMENDSLWIMSDDTKWCISKNSLIEMFDGTPIFFSIMGLNYETEEKTKPYQFLNISPKYIEIFVQILRKERSISIDWDFLPKFHYEFFGIDIIKTNIVKGFFSNIEKIILDEISLDGKQTLREMN